MVKVTQNTLTGSHLRSCFANHSKACCNFEQLHYANELRLIIFDLVSVLEDADYNYIINYNDDERKEIKGAGTTFLFTKQNQKETITSQGPLKKSVTLMVSTK